MEPREAKLRKLNSVRNSIPHVTQSALASLVSHARDLPEACSTKDIRDARDLDTNIVTPYGPLLTEVLGAEI
eukprot:3225729-Pyramimonas_sp.AAC.2